MRGGHDHEGRRKRHPASNATNRCATAASCATKACHITKAHYTGMDECVAWRAVYRTVVEYAARHYGISNTMFYAKGG
jgi:hypothetical protein